MRTFEKDDHQKITISEISYNGVNISASFSDGDQEKVIKGYKRIHDDFNTSFGAVSKMIAKKLKTGDADPPYHLSVYGIKYAIINKRKGYKISCELMFLRIGCDCKLTVPLIIPPYDNYWEERDKHGNLLHKPEEEPSKLTDDEIECIEKVFTEAYLYFYENKHKPDEQPDLFSDEETDEISEALEQAGKIANDFIKDKNIKEIQIGGKTVYRRKKKDEEHAD